MANPDWRIDLTLCRTQPCNIWKATFSSSKSWWKRPRSLRVSRTCAKTWKRKENKSTQRLWKSSRKLKIPSMNIELNVGRNLRRSQAWFYQVSKQTNKKQNKTPLLICAANTLCLSVCTPVFFNAIFFLAYLCNRNEKSRLLRGKKQLDYKPDFSKRRSLPVIWLSCFLVRCGWDRTQMEHFIPTSADTLEGGKAN